MSFKEEFLRKQQALSKLQQEVWEMKKNCPHEEKVAKLVETLAFEFSPRYLCPLCGEQLSGDVSKSEVKECYQEWLSDIEELTEEKLEAHYNANPRGFNLPRRKI